MNILLVDDNIYTIRALKSGIDYNALGITGVYTARNMACAVEWLGKEEIPLVLTDIEMPNGTGLQLLEWINEHRPGIVTLFVPVTRILIMQRRQWSFTALTII